MKNEKEIMDRMAELSARTAEFASAAMDAMNALKSRIEALESAPDDKCEPDFGDLPCLRGAADAVVAALPKSPDPSLAGNLYAAISSFEEAMAEDRESLGALSAANDVLRKENASLKREVEDLKKALEKVKTEVSTVRNEAEFVSRGLAREATEREVRFADRLREIRITVWGS